MRDATAIGVAFVEDEPVHRDMSSSKAARLESEVRRLKTVISQLTKRLEDLGQDVSVT